MPVVRAAWMSSLVVTSQLVAIAVPPRSVMRSTVSWLVSVAVGGDDAGSLGGERGGGGAADAAAGPGDERDLAGELGVGAVRHRWAPYSSSVRWSAHSVSP